MLPKCRETRTSTRAYPLDRGSHGGRLPKINILEYVTDALTKILHTITGYRLADVEVLVEHFSRVSVDQLSDYGIALLYRCVTGVYHSHSP